MFTKPHIRQGQPDQSEPFVQNACATMSRAMKMFAGKCRCLNIVKPKSSPKSKSQIQVPNLSLKFKVQSPEERDYWD